MSSQKRGGYRGVSIDSFRLPTPSLKFFLTLKGLIFYLNRKKPVPSFRAKNVESLLIWIPLPKTQRRIKTFVGSDMWSLIIENMLCGCKLEVLN